MCTKLFVIKNIIKWWWNWFLLYYFYFQFLSIIHSIDQACPTYGPRAKCGLQKLLFWPAKPQNLFILVLPLVKTPFECVKTYQLWPLDMSKKFWPTMRFELCTPVIDVPIFRIEEKFKHSNFKIHLKFKVELPNPVYACVFNISKFIGFVWYWKCIHKC